MYIGNNMVNINILIYNSQVTNVTNINSCHCVNDEERMRMIRNSIQQLIYLIFLLCLSLEEAQAIAPNFLPYYTDYGNINYPDYTYQNNYPNYAYQNNYPNYTYQDNYPNHTYQNNNYNSNSVNKEYEKDSGSLENNDPRHFEWKEGIKRNYESENEFENEYLKGKEHREASFEYSRKIHAKYSDNGAEIDDRTYGKAGFNSEFEVHSKDGSTGFKQNSSIEAGFNSRSRIKVDDEHFYRSNEIEGNVNGKTGVNFYRKVGKGEVSGGFETNFDANLNHEKYEYISKERYNRGTQINANVSFENEIKGEYKQGDKSIGGKLKDSYSAGFQGQGNIIKEKDKYYAELGGSANAEKKKQAELEIKNGNSSTKLGGSVSVSAYAEANLKVGSATSRQGDEIVSKGGIYGAARLGAGINGSVSTSFSNGQDNINAEFSLGVSEGFGGAFGYYSEARVNTNNWNVKFNAFAEIDISKLPVGGSVKVDGNVSIADEIRQIRNELSNYVREKENEELAKLQQGNKANAKKIDRNQLKKRILQNIPGWKSKLAVIKQKVRQKAQNLIQGVAQKSNETVKKLIEAKAKDNRIIKIFKNVASTVAQAAVNISSKVVSLLTKIVMPRIDAAINEIKPTDVAKIG